MRKLAFIALLTLVVVAVAIAQGSQAANESLWEAARSGDTAGITAALAKGADVNAKSRYDVTPLISCGNGLRSLVRRRPSGTPKAALGLMR
jgi:hypothetical protein